VKALLNQGVQKIGIDVTTSAHGAAEGATLAMHSFDRLKNPKSRKPLVDIGPFLETVENVDPFLTWETGQIYGASQNLARSLMETPANLMTPKIFAEEIAYLLAGLEKVEVIVRDEEWAKRQGMNALIGVAKGR
jgi:aminopeptidase